MRAAENFRRRPHPRRAIAGGKPQQRPGLLGGRQVIRPCWDPFGLGAAAPSQAAGFPSSSTARVDDPMEAAIAGILFRRVEESGGWLLPGQAAVQRIPTPEAGTLGISTGRSRSVGLPHCRVGRGATPDFAVVSNST